MIKKSKSKSEIELISKTLDESISKLIEKKKD